MKGNERVTLTQKRISSPKLFVYLASGVSIALDLVLLAVLIVGGYPERYLAAPIVVLIADTAFFAASFFTNFRFRYSAVRFAVYLPVVLSCVFSECSLMRDAGNNLQLVTETAFLLYLTSHIISCAAVLLACLRAAKLKHIRIAAIALCSVSFALSAGYAVFLFGKGFVGQSLDGRPVLFEYDGEREGYIARGLEEGRSKLVRIPESFDGKPVVEIDCSLFAEEGIDTVILECSPEVAFSSEDKVKDIPETLRVSAEKENFDTFRNHFLTLALEERQTSLLEFADRFVPVIGKKEVFVTFSYDLASLERLQGECFPTWFGKKGDTFSRSALGTSVSALEHADPSDDEDLSWCFEHSDGMILRDFTYEGNSLEGANVAEGRQNVNVSFDKIYKIYLEEDNDTMYTPAEEYACSSVGGNRLGFRYLTADYAETFLTQGERDGFTVEYKFGVSAGSATVKLDSLSELMRGGSVTGESIYLAATWKLNAPVLKYCTADKQHPVYGDEVTFSAEATSPAEDLSLRYSWKRPNETYESGSSFTIESISPVTDAGKYVLTVTAYGDSTSLTSETGTNFTCSVAKKTLDCTWNRSGTNTYDAQTRTVTCSIDGAQFVGEDEVTFTYPEENSKSVKNAGEYRFTAKLNEDWTALYTLSPTQNYSFRIERAPLTLQWKLDGGESFTCEYNGSEHSVTVDGANFRGSDNISFEVTKQGDFRSAGAHTATAALDTRNELSSNYTVSNPDRTVTVTPKNLQVKVQPKEKTYDGRAFGAGAASLTSDYTVEGLAGGDTESEVIVSAYFTGEGTMRVNAGTAALSVECRQHGTKWNNYSVEVDPSQITINQKDLTVTVNRKTKVYDGYPLNGTVSSSDYTVGELASGDTAAQVFTRFTYSGEGAENASAGSHTYTLTYTGGQKIGNYNVSVTSSTVEVSKKPITIKAENVTKTYDGLSLTGTPRYTVSLAQTDGNEEVFATVSYSGDAVGKKDVGTYTIELSYTSGSKAGNYSISAEAGTLTVNAKRISITWGGKSFVYDGNAHKPTATSPDWVSGDGDSLLSFTYSVSEPKDAGEYTATAKLDERGNYAFSDGKYQSELTYNITSKTVRLTWSTETFREDGEEHAPTASSEDFVGSVPIEYEYFRGGEKLSGKPTQEGSYTVKAKVSGNNYTLENSEHEFTIGPREVEE